jgi:DNA-directed RNA polymerase specialized sigma24 family protein
VGVLIVWRGVLMRSAEDSREEMFEELVKLHRRELTRFAVRQLGEPRAWPRMSSRRRS